MANNRFTLFTLALFSTFIPAAVGDTCGSISSTTSIEVEAIQSPQYIEEQQNYWSTACGALKPSCQPYPRTAEEVSSIVKILNAKNETFAVKSGGHNPNKGFSSIQDGPLISTKLLNEVSFNRDTMTVRVGPGNDWEDIHNGLEGTNVTVVGGRIGEVGVGGYVLGGGLSFLSTQHGWAANNIVEFEVVLANATIVTASNTTNSDLYKALKGGGNAFGIVTAFTMQTYPQDLVWGGSLVFPANKTDQMLAAVRDFTEYYPDEKAAIIVNAILSATALEGIDMWFMFVLYDGPTPPAGVFDNFTAIGPTTNDCKTRTYTDLLTSNNFNIRNETIYTISTESVPLPDAADGAEVLGAVYDHWRNTTNSVLDVDEALGSIAFQPIPKSMARKAREMGGDIIDLDDDVDRLIMEYIYSYKSNIDDAKIDTATQQVYGGTKDIVTRFTQDGKLPQAYLPLFANVGYFRQDYWGRLRTADFARSVRDQYDPKGFFAGLTGGYKL